MTVARTVADVLTEHVVFEVECIDRMYLNVYVPQLQHAGGLVGYVQRQLGLCRSRRRRRWPRSPTGSCARCTASPRQSRSRGWTSRRASARTTSCANGWPGSPPRKGWCSSAGRRRRPRCSAPRSAARSDGRSYPWIVKTTGVVNQFYFYCVDDDFGPFFLKFCSYFPYNAKLCINGNHWAQAPSGQGRDRVHRAGQRVRRRARTRPRCRRSATGSGPEQIDALLRKWLAILPHPFTAADRAAGYRYDMSILQAEFSLTQMLDRPVTGRVFFEQVIRENLDIGRPDQVSLIFDRRLKRCGYRATPGRVPHPGDHRRASPRACTWTTSTPASSSTTRKGERLRTETTINDTRDFEIGKRLVNLPALREIGFSANRRLLRVQRLDHDPITGTNDLHTITDPITTETGTRVPGLRLGQQRSHALLAALQIFRLQPAGFPNAEFRTLVAQLRGLPEHDVSAGQMTYDLRRLRVHGLIERIPHSHRYRVTDLGLHTAMLITRVQERVLPTGLAHLTDPASTARLRTAANAYQLAIDNLTREQGIAA